MFDVIRKHAAKALAAAFALGNASGCAVLPKVIPGAQTADAVREVCVEDRHAEETAFCLIAAYTAAVDALAAEREAGTLSPEVVRAADAAIAATGPRVAAAARTWGAVAGWRDQVERLKPLADQCVAVVSDRSRLPDCLSAVGYLTATGELRSLIAQAKADWSTLEPQIRTVIGLANKE